MLNIKQRQINLKFLGFYTKNIDGIEGICTKQAYKDFQKEYGLVVDGIYGVKTDTKLIDVIKAEQKRLDVKQDGVAGIITTKARDNQLRWNNIKHFKQNEFTCKCGCGLNNIDLKVVKVADAIREHFRQPCIITSGCRCTKHNKKVGGVSNSRHLNGKAVDLYVKNVRGKDLFYYTKQLENQGKLRYTYLIVNNAVHIDIE